MAGPVGCSFDNYSFPQHAIAKKCRLPLLAGPRRWRWFPQGRRTYRRHGRRDTGGLGTKAQLLKSLGIKLPRSIQPMRFLEFSGRFDRRSVPFPVGFSGEGTVLGERLLNLRNAVGGGNFLPPLPPA